MILLLIFEIKKHITTKRRNAKRQKKIVSAYFNVRYLEYSNYFPSLSLIPIGNMEKISRRWAHSVEDVMQRSTRQMLKKMWIITSRNDHNNLFEFCLQLPIISHRRWLGWNNLLTFNSCIVFESMEKIPFLCSLLPKYLIWWPARSTDVSKRHFIEMKLNTKSFKLKIYFSWVFVCLLFGSIMAYFNMSIKILLNTDFIW